MNINTEPKRHVRQITEEQAIESAARLLARYPEREFFIHRDGIVAEQPWSVLSVLPLTPRCWRCGSTRLLLMAAGVRYCADCGEPHYIEE